MGAHQLRRSRRNTRQRDGARVPGVSLLNPREVDLPLVSREQQMYDRQAEERLVTVAACFNRDLDHGRPLCCVGDDRRELVVLFVVRTVVLVDACYNSARCARSSSGRALRLHYISDAREGPPRDAADGLEAPPQRPGVSSLDVDADDAVSMGRDQVRGGAAQGFRLTRARSGVRDEASSGNRIATTGSGSLNC